MKLTIIYDNTVFKKNLKSDWGFSAYIETKNNQKILFDTGGSGKVLLYNMKQLDIDPKNVDEVFISHAHFDHTGGLSAFLSENSQVKVWVPPSFRGVKNAKKVIKLDKPLKLHENIYSTGELERIEQFLCVKTKKGIVVIAGCSHPDMNNILKTASRFGNLFGIIGGLHGTYPESLKKLKFICPAHCTQHKKEIQRLYPYQYSEGGAGKIIEII